MSLSLNKKRLQCNIAAAKLDAVWGDTTSCELEAEEVIEDSEGIEAEVEVDVIDIGRE